MARPIIRCAPALAVLLLAGACGGDDDTSTASTPAPAGAATVETTVGNVDETVGGDAADERFPDVIEAVAELDTGIGTWTFQVTMASPYDMPSRYADGWRVVGADGTVFGVHTLAHDHAAEQPFTRTQTGVEIPDDVDTVVVEGRDIVSGFGGTTVTVTLDRE